MWTNMDRRWLKARLDIIDAKLDALLAVTLVTENEAMATIEDLVEAVAQQSTVIDGATTAIDGLRAQLEAAGVDPAKLDALKAAIEENTGRLAAAIARNTDADDEVHASQM